ncbi:MAG: leucine-rich repeat domain-containing protein [Lepagella sp.]
MKRFTFSLACAALLCSQAIAEDPITIEGLNYELNQELKTATVVAGTYTGDIVIPEAITVEEENYDVKQIGANAFKQQTITSVVIPNSVDSIMTAAFMSCRQMTTLNLGTGVKYCGKGAFAGCTALKNLNITDLSAWCGIEFYDYNANPANFTKAITLNGEIITDLVIPNDVEEIKNYAFYNVNNLQSITFGSGVKKIGDSAFYYCYNVPSLTIPANVTEIGTGTFSSMRGVTEMTIEEGLESIGTDAFRGCQGLTAVTFPASLKKIGATAFASCSALEEVSFICGVDTIAKDAFSLNNKIAKVNVTSLEEWAKINFETIKSNPVNVSKTLYVDGEELTAIEVPEGVEEVKNFTYCALPQVTSITLHEGLKEIGNSAFWSCSGVETITIPESVTRIGDAAFQSCSALTSINIPAALDTIPANMLNKCAKLPSVEIPENVKYIGDFAFSGCSELETVVFPKNIEYVGNYALQNCAKLERIVFPKAVEVKMGMCQGCTALKRVVIQNSEKNVGYNAFGNCSALEEVWINTPFVAYSQFSTMTAPTYYVPYGSVDTWKEKCPNNTFKECSTLETDENGYTTYYIYADYSMPLGFEGCAITGGWTRYDGVNKLVKGDVFEEGSTVPYDTPLLISGEPNTFAMFEVIRDHGDRFDGENALRGSNNGDIVMIDDRKAYFMLGYDEYGAEYGFMPVLEINAFEVPAHTAYLAIPAEDAAEFGYQIRFYGDEEEDFRPSSVNTIDTDHTRTIDAIYRIDGTRVNANAIEQLAPGFYIIDGEKVMVK